MCHQPVCIWLTESQVDIPGWSQLWWKCCLLICPFQLSEHWLLHAVIHVTDLHVSCVHDSLVDSAPELGVQTFITSLASVNTYTARSHSAMPRDRTHTLTQDVMAGVTCYEHHHAYQQAAHQAGCLCIRSKLAKASRSVDESSFTFSLSPRSTAQFELDCGKRYRREREMYGKYCVSQWRAHDCKVSGSVATLYVVGTLTFSLFVNIFYEIYRVSWPFWTDGPWADRPLDGRCLEATLSKDSSLVSTIFDVRY